MNVRKVMSLQRIWFGLTWTWLLKTSKVCGQQCPDLLSAGSLMAKFARFDAFHH